MVLHNATVPKVLFHTVRILRTYTGVTCTPRLAENTGSHLNHPKYLDLTLKLHHANVIVGTVLGGTQVYFIISQISPLNLKNTVLVFRNLYFFTCLL